MSPNLIATKELLEKARLADREDKGDGMGGGFAQDDMGRARGGRTFVGGCGRCCGMRAPLRGGGAGGGARRPVREPFAFSPNR